jgi:hypothetical protein
MKETIYYRWQHLRDGVDVTGQMFCMEDLDQVRAWSGAHGDLLVAELRVTSNGRWSFTDSGLFQFLPGECVTFRSPAAAMKYLIVWRDTNLAVARCRCNEPGADCD